MNYIERKCTITNEGREFSAGGAVVTPDAIIAYVGKTTGDGMGCDRHGKTSLRELTDWHGEVIGTCYISSTWRTQHSYVSSTMHQIYATVDGINYTGRSAGEGMIFRGRKVR